MSDAAPRIDVETRAFLAALTGRENPAIVAFVESVDERTDALAAKLRALDVVILGVADRVVVINAPARILTEVAALTEASGVEGWPAAARQQGAHPRDISLLEQSAGRRDRKIPALVRLSGEPDAAAQEWLQMVGVAFFPNQTGSVRAATLPAHALNDAIAIPVVAAVKLSQANLARGEDLRSASPPKTTGEHKLSATTRMLLQETFAQDDPIVAVFVELGSPPTPQEKARMDALGLHIISGAGPIKTGRIPLRAIAPLSALDCVAAVEAASPLHLENRAEPNRDEPYDTKP